VATRQIDLDEVRARAGQLESSASFGLSQNGVWVAVPGRGRRRAVSRSLTAAATRSSHSGWVKLLRSGLPSAGVGHSPPGRGPRRRGPGTATTGNGVRRRSARPAEPEPRPKPARTRRRSSVSRTGTAAPQRSRPGRRRLSARPAARGREPRPTTDSGAPRSSRPDAAKAAAP
jgi:hypothetical protein